jgi:hypothetical protein
VDIRLLEDAKRDLRSGWFFYERQAPDLSDRFPFALYDLIEADTIDIYAILDCRRDPSWIQQRLAGPPPPA